MVNKFCPKCGTSTNQLGLCSNCTKEGVKLTYETPLIQISEFNRMFHKGTWRHFDDIEDIIKSRVCEALGKEVDIKVPSFEFTPQPKEKTKFTVFATIDEKEVPLEVKMSYMQCDFGQKQKTAYYEGILQLREPNDTIFAFLDKEMKQLAPKGVFITKTVDQKNGVDLYFTNKTQMNLLGQKLSMKFGAEVTTHPQLFSHNHQTSKDIYRLNILATFPKFTTGDVISFVYPRKGKITALIKKMGKITHGFDLNLQKQIGFEIKNCSDIEVYKKQETTITNIHPQMGVLDPETYQEEIPYNPLKKQGEAGGKVFVVKTPHGLYIVD